jgi:hypothetical protein
MRFMFALSLAIRSPSSFLMPLSAMSSVVPVAMAMDPEKVLQAARAVASPAFWMVAVADVEQLDWAAAMR